MGDSEIHRIDVLENTFTLKGFYTNVDQGCALGSRELPGVFTLSGTCGKAVTVDPTTVINGGNIKIHKGN